MGQTSVTRRAGTGSRVVVNEPDFVRDSYLDRGRSADGAEATGVRSCVSEGVCSCETDGRIIGKAAIGADDYVTGATARAVAAGFRLGSRDHPGVRGGVETEVVS